MKLVVNCADVEVEDRHVKSPLYVTTVRHNPRLSRYEIAVYDGVLAGFALYERHGRRIAFLHIEIEPRHEGARPRRPPRARCARRRARARSRGRSPLPVHRCVHPSHADEYLDLVVPAMREPLVEDGRPI